MQHNIFKLFNYCKYFLVSQWDAAGFLESQWLVVQSCEGNWRKATWLPCKVSLCGLHEQEKWASIGTWPGIVFLSGQQRKSNKHCFVALFKSYRIRSNSFPSAQILSFYDGQSKGLWWLKSSKISQKIGVCILSCGTSTNHRSATRLESIYYPWIVLSTVVNY